MAHIKSNLAMAVVFLAGSAAAFAADWPMWRYDAARSGASSNGIATNLTLLWSRKLPPVCPAWPLANDERSGFDSSYEPVVMGKLLFIGSPNNGSITAYDTETGQEKWKFYTEGPVRCAPACSASRNDAGRPASGKGKIYAGSDDGYLYCLNAQTGELLWKFRGTPQDRPDRHILGNEHLISFWPVRGGPVVKDDIVYFGAGIWPIFGVFFYALDAESGKVKWINRDSNYIAKVRSDHDTPIEGGLSPQGHLVAIKDRLVVPCGRAMPAGLELATGKLIYWTQGYYGVGDSHVAAHGNHAFAGKNAMVNLYDFREAGSKWAYRGNNPPEGYKEGLNQSLPDLLETVWAEPYKLVEGCNSSSAFSDGIAYGSAKGTFYAYDIENARLFEREQVWGGKKIHPLTWQPPLLWQYKTPYAGQKSDLVIKAGNRIYGYAGKKLLALENLKGPPALAWEKDIDGTPSSLIAADNKFFVATAEGGLYCFGDGQPGMNYAAQTEPLESKHEPAAKKVDAIIKATGVKAGYCLVLGLTDGSLVEELVKKTDLVIIGVDADAKKVDALRRRFDRSGFYGSRVELLTGDPFTFLFPPYLASLMIAEDDRAFYDSLNKTDLKKLFDVLRPYGGTLCLKVPENDLPGFGKKVNAAQLAQAVLKKNDGLSLLVREGALPGAAPWTHDACDAANTLCAKDDFLKAPLGFLWFGDQNRCAQDVHAGEHVTTKVNGGRVYVIQQQRPRMLIAYDAFTGRFLWKNDFNSFHASFAAMDDAIYLAMDGKCILYDPESGAKLDAFIFNQDNATRVKGISVDGDVILILCDTPDGELDKKIRGTANDGLWMPEYFNSSTLVCLDRKKGNELWRRNAKKRFMNRGLLIAEGIVFCIDADPIPVQPPPKKVEVVSASEVFALNVRTGTELWAKKIPYKYFGWLNHGLAGWAAYAPDTGIVLAGRYNLVSAFNLKTGKPVWKNKEFYWPLRNIINGQTFILQNGAIHDISTGKQIRQIPFTRFGCNYAIGSKHLMAVRMSSAGYIDLDNGKVYALRNIRSGCRNNLIPGDGLLNSPNSAMVCSCCYAIRTSFAMVHMPEVAAWSGAAPFVMTPPPALPGMESKIEKIKGNPIP